MFSEAAGSGYLTADLLAKDVMEKMDITDIQHADESFDVIFCSHVLEHVQDDRKAMREFFRVLRSTGWAILNVPISVEKTFEDPNITNPAERLHLFGQEDHVRRYGHDYKSRLEEAGFSVTVYSAASVVGDQDLERHGLATKSAGKIFFCKKK